ncbi:MAG: sensor domain-containing diguanylate cyclase [Roseateles sp.]|uniref:diguanylate cyclase domain-containing protein n=1 Tax=Roseateles sp. TaxID=1971397 RepID=UPI0039E72C51
MTPRRPAAPAVRPELRTTLRAQFVRHLLPLMFLAFVLAAVVTAAVVFQRERAQQLAQRQATLDGYAHALSKPLWDCDAATVRGIVDTLIQVPTVASARVHDVCGGNLVEAGHPPPAGRGGDLGQAPVDYRDEQGRHFKVGQLDIQFKPLSTTGAAIDAFLPQLAIFGVMLGAMLAGASAVFRRTIGGRLAKFRLAILAHRSVQQNEALLGQRASRRHDELTDVLLAYDELMRELDARFARQATLAQCARALLSSSTAGPRPLAGVLADVLKTLDADRAYLAENVAPAGAMPAAAITTLAGADLPDDARHAQPYGPGLQRWQACFEERTGVIGRVPDLPEPERQALAAQGVRSFAALPVWGHSQWHGYLCVQDLRTGRDWSESESIFLRTVADMVGAFLEDQQHAQELARAVQRLRDSEVELKRLAREDALTGLANRVALEEQLPRAVRRALRDGRQGFVLLLDLDGFKPINDTHGHAAGDFVLKTVASRLSAAVRNTDLVARLGGDEFVVVIEGQGTAADLPGLLAKLREAIEAPIACEGVVLRVSASIGVACFPEHGTDSAPLLAHADGDMYDGKRERQGR